MIASIRLDLSLKVSATDKRSSLLYRDVNEKISGRSRDATGHKELPDVGSFENMVNSFLKNNLDIDLGPML